MSTLLKAAYLNKMDVNRFKEMEVGRFDDSTVPSIALSDLLKELPIIFNGLLVGGNDNLCKRNVVFSCI